MMGEIDCSKIFKGKVEDQIILDPIFYCEMFFRASLYGALVPHISVWGCVFLPTVGLGTP